MDDSNKRLRRIGLSAASYMQEEADIASHPPPVSLFLGEHTIGFSSMSPA